MNASVGYLIFLKFLRFYNPLFEKTRDYMFWGILNQNLLFQLLLNLVGSLRGCSTCGGIGVLVIRLAMIANDIAPTVTEGKGIIIEKDKAQGVYSGLPIEDLAIDGVFPPYQE